MPAFARLALAVLIGGAPAWASKWEISSILTLRKCYPDDYTQQFFSNPNGTIAIQRGNPTAFCISASNLVPQGNNNPQRKGNHVLATDCGEEQQTETWAIEGSTIKSKHNGTCLSMKAGGNVGACPESAPCDVISGAELASCSASDAQFIIGFTGKTAGPIVHQSSGLCVTVGTCPAGAVGDARCAAHPGRSTTCAAAAAARASAAPFAAGNGTKPCDVYGAAGNPCVAAHSMIRALYQDYDGPLYAVKNGDKVKDVTTLGAGGYADSAAQDAFCGKSKCIVTKIYDQSPNGNHLGIFTGDPNHNDTGVNATRDKHVIHGHPVYSAYFEEHAGSGYRNIAATKGVATGTEPESMYAVFSGKHFGGACCFDYGNAEAHVSHGDNLAGTMEAVYFGGMERWWRLESTNGSKLDDGIRAAPMIMADIEMGVFAGDDFVDPNAVPTWGEHEYVTAMLKGDGGCHMTLKGSDAQSGPLQTLWDGLRPQHSNTWNPMALEGGIILGTGGDNSHGGFGTWFEGAMVRGWTSDATDDAVQASIAEAYSAS